MKMTLTARFCLLTKDNQFRRGTISLSQPCADIDDSRTVLVLQLETLYGPIKDLNLTFRQR